MTSAPAPPTRRLRRLRAALRPLERSVCDVGSITVQGSCDASGGSAAAMAAAPDDDARSPWRWGAAEWEAMRARPARRLLEPAALASIDRQAFLRDGFVVLPGCMAAEARGPWRAALQHAQAVQDNFVRNSAHWGSLIDWAALGRPGEWSSGLPPRCRLTQVVAAIRWRAERRALREPGQLCARGVPVGRAG